MRFLRSVRNNAHLAKTVDLVSKSDGSFTTEVRGVKIAKCDEYGKTRSDYQHELTLVYLEQERQLVDMLNARIQELEAP